MFSLAYAGLIWLYFILQHRNSTLEPASSPPGINVIGEELTSKIEENARLHKQVSKGLFCLWIVYSSEYDICQHRSTDLLAVLKLYVNSLLYKFDRRCTTYSTDPAELR